jgi:hypothetical protein
MCDDRSVIQLRIFNFVSLSTASLLSTHIRNAIHSMCHRHVHTIRNVEGGQQQCVCASIRRTNDGYAITLRNLDVNVLEKGGIWTFGIAKFDVGDVIGSGRRIPRAPRLFRARVELQTPVVIACCYGDLAICWAIMKELISTQDMNKDWRSHTEGHKLGSNSDRKHCYCYPRPRPKLQLMTWGHRCPVVVPATHLQASTHNDSGCRWWWAWGFLAGYASATVWWSLWWSPLCG